jgi:hypothetical protein
MRARRGEALKFLEKAIACRDSECLLWPYNRNNKGRAMIGGGGHAHMRTVQVHILVCAAVNGPKPTLAHEVSHTCHNGKNACVNGTHLQWATKKENFAAQHGQRYWQQKLTVPQIQRIRAMLELGLWQQKEIAQQFNVSEPTITAIKVGDRWGWHSQGEKA